MTTVQWPEFLHPIPREAENVVGRENLAMKFGLICVSTLCRCADAKIAQRLKSTFFWGKISQSMGP